MTLYEKRPYMLCAKCFVLFVLWREGGGVRDNYTQNYAITELSRDN